jgi:transposase InsO family protein
VYRDPRFERLAGLSVAHLYNLRKTRAYREQRVSFTKTRATANSIGVRRAPAPQGRPGFVRVDSVHQGDLDGIKGVYHINAVDCVTQWEIVACCERISEAFLLPVLEQLIEQFPFRVLGFHADNGSEYINHTVARLLNKLNAEFTKSRPRHSNDNALAETKNGVVVRKFFGYSHIPQRFASRINEFCRLHLNPYLNLHRPCLFAAETPDPAKPGRIRKTYPHNLVQTPLEKLASLPNVAEFLKPNTPLHALLQRAHSCTDLQAAADLNAQRMLLFESFKKRSVRSA